MGAGGARSVCVVGEGSSPGLVNVDAAVMVTRELGGGGACGYWQRKASSERDMVCMLGEDLPRAEIAGEIMRKIMREIIRSLCRMPSRPARKNTNSVYGR